MANAIHISEAASLALHSMALLAQAKDDKWISVKQIAGATGASEAHLAKVFQRLVRAGLVNSGRGPTGGFSLAKPSEEITLLQIYEAIEGEIIVEPCLLSRESCLLRKCLFDGLLEKMSNDLKNHFQNTNLADMAGK